jgi:hypothetical protein
VAFEALSILGHSLERNTIVKYDFKEKLIVVTIFFTNKEFHNSASYLNDKKNVYNSHVLLQMLNPILRIFMGR